MTSAHLLVLVHGMWGNPGHLAEMARRIRDASATPTGMDFHLLVAETNVEDYTYDGVDHGGERVAEEVISEVEKLRNDGRKVTKFSMTGYSLGGLVSRYVIGVLHQRKFFDDIAPVNFNTFATPHIGLPRYPNFFSALATSLGPTFLSRTGKQIFALDKWSNTGRPILDVMADPDRVFYKALELFQNITIYANSVNDLTVPYVTAAIELDDPFLDYPSNGIEINLHEDYANLIKSYQFPTDGSVKALSATKPKPPFLPIPFPYNLMIYLSLPILVPAALSLVIVRISLAAHSSRRRIKLLEKDESYSSKLAHIVEELEKEMEDAAVEFIDNPAGMDMGPSAIATAEASEDKWWKPCSPSTRSGEHPKFCSCNRKPVKQAPTNSNLGSTTSFDSAEATPSEKTEGKVCKWHSWRRKHKEATPSRPSSTPSTHPSSSDRTPPESSDETTENRPKSCSCFRNKKNKIPSRDKLSPVLTDLHKDMITSLNKIPHLKKQLAFIDDVRNTHGFIVCRSDVLKYIQPDGSGDGAVKHWAHNFVF